MSRRSKKPRVSREAELLAHRVETGSPEYIQQNLARFMEASAGLRRERELRDLYFSRSRTGEVAREVLAAHSVDSSQIQQATGDEKDGFYRELETELIDRLATPDFRADVLRRLERLGARLRSGSDMEKLETAMFVSSVLRADQVPWGACGLVRRIYQESIERAAKELELADQALHDLMGIHPEMGLEELVQTITAPDRRAEFQKQLEADPEFARELEKEADEALAAFEQDVAQGKILLELFTPEEVERGFSYMAEYIQSHQVDMATADPNVHSGPLRDALRRALGEIATRERLAEMRGVLEKQSLAWIQKGNPHGVFLQMELTDLEEIDPTENPFLLGVYLAQGKSGS